MTFDFSKIVVLFCLGKPSRSTFRGISLNSDLTETFLKFTPPFKYLWVNRVIVAADFEVKITLKLQSGRDKGSI